MPKFISALQDLKKVQVPVEPLKTQGEGVSIAPIETLPAFHNFLAPQGIVKPGRDTKHNLCCAVSSYLQYMLKCMQMTLMGQFPPVYR